MYWVGDELPSNVSATTSDAKPLVVIASSELLRLKRTSEEQWALRKLNSTAAELRTDGVARREVRQRLMYSLRALDSAWSASFIVGPSNIFWFEGEQQSIKTSFQLVAKLSSLCDQFYSATPILWNELVNRRELSTQGAKARRELIGAMLTSSQVERLALEGNGPEYSMYASVLRSTGIHRESAAGTFVFDSPKDESMMPVWNAIEKYCLESIEQPRSVQELFVKLNTAPYGLKQGVIPILLAAVLIKRVDDICIYKDGSFVPVLGLEHFELLFKNPARFAVKHFVNSGLRAQVFRALEELVKKPGPVSKNETRNVTLLSVVKPLVNFGSKLPNYTKKTKSLSSTSLALRDALTSAKQPDELLFKIIPEALGLSEIIPGSEENVSITKEFSTRFLTALREIQFAYDSLLTNCKQNLAHAFGLDTSELRQTLAMRAKALTFKGIRTPLESFFVSAADESVDEKVWLERVLMVIGDKPVISWTDEDVQLFEIGVKDFVRRFNNFESLYSETNVPSGVGFDARKITLTKPDGQEVHRVLWLDPNNEAEVNEIAKEFLNERLKNKPQLREAVISKLAELILQGESLENEKVSG